MAFLDHLEEFRRRIIVCGVTIILFMVVSLSFSQVTMRILMFPLNMPINTLLAAVIDRTVGSEGSIMGFFSIALRASGSSIDAEIIKGGVIEGIMAYLKISITCGVLLASPVILYQVWAFVFPALTQQEKRFALPLFLIIVFFFLVGAIFAYFIVIPVILEFSAKLFPDLANLWELERYVNFLTRLLLGFGIAFELPIVMAFLSRIGVINAQGFRERQSYAVVGIFTMSAMLTPADVLSMLLMGIPLMLLYQLGIFFAFLVEQEPESYA
ncbi:MAG: twin-arginine translocase subunit TatC [Candidatus Poribacteria bacterium]|nr:twin-arginine translocase subunit TatC [Candidatus Poribacteria bacterium]